MVRRWCLGNPPGLLFYIFPTHIWFQHLQSGQALYFLNTNSVLILVGGIYRPGLTNIDHNPGESCRIAASRRKICWRHSLACIFIGSAVDMGALWWRNRTNGRRFVVLKADSVGMMASQTIYICDFLVWRRLRGLTILHDPHHLIIYHLLNQ
jgi:hypothetical protein